MLLIVGAILMIAGALWQAIFSLARALQRRASRRAEWRGRALPAELQPREIAAAPPAPVRRPRRGDPYGPFDADELQRILDALRQQRAA